MTTHPEPPPLPTPPDRRARLTKDTVRAMEWVQEHQARPIENAVTDWFLKRFYDWQTERDA